jgi:hypothetical protein
MPVFSKILANSLFQGFLRTPAKANVVKSGEQNAAEHFTQQIGRNYRGSLAKNRNQKLFFR